MNQENEIQVILELAHFIEGEDYENMAFKAVK